MRACAFHIENRASTVEAHIHRNSGFKTRIGKRPVQQLPIAYDNVARVANQRNSSGNAFAAGFFDKLGDINFSLLVAARQNPNAVYSRAAVNLGHEIEPVNATVKVRIIPMRRPVLMP